MERGKLSLGLVSFTVSSMMIPLMTLFTRDKNITLATILASVFWVMLIVGIVSTCVLAKTVRRTNQMPIWRAFIPFRSRVTKIVDTVFVTSIVATLALTICKINSDFMQRVLLFMDVYLLELHFLLSLTTNQSKNKGKNNGEN